MNRKYLYIVVPILLLVIVSALLSLHKKRSAAPVGFSEGAESVSAGDHSLDLANISLDGARDVFEIKGGVVYKNGIAVSVDSTEYARVKKVAYFYRLMRERPLLYSETLDLTDFKNSIELMSKIEGKALDFTGYKTSVFARSFMTAFYVSSDSFGKFAANPGEGSARDLLTSIEKTNSAYKFELNSLKSEILNLKSSLLGEKELSMLGGENFTSASVILSDIDKLSSNSDALGLEIARRKKCLTDGLCDYSHEELVSDGSSIASLLPFSELSVNNVGSLRGPYEAYSKCWKGADINNFYISDENSLHGYGFTKFYLASKGYWSKLNPAFGSFEKLLYDKGVRLIPQSGATPYMCPDLRYKASVTSMDAFKKNNRKAFRNIDVGDSEGRKLVEEGSKLEEDFFNSKTTKESDFNELGNAYWNAYLYFAKHGPTASRDAMLNGYLSVREKLAGYPKVMSEIAYYMNTYLDEAPKHSKVELPVFIYILKSNYSISFMNASPNVLLGNLMLRYFAYPGTDSNNIVFGIIDYAKAQTMYGEKKLQEWLDIFHRYDRADREKYYSNIK